MTSSVYTYCADAFAQAGDLKNAYTYAGKVFSTAHSALLSFLLKKAIVKMP